MTYEDLVAGLALLAVVVVIYRTNASLKKNAAPLNRSERYYQPPPKPEESKVMTKTVRTDPIVTAQQFHERDTRMRGAPAQDNWTSSELAQAAMIASGIDPRFVIATGIEEPLIVDRTTSDVKECTSPTIDTSSGGCSAPSNTSGDM